MGIARVVIRTREYLAAVLPEDDALVLILMRYPQELVDPNDYVLPEGAASNYRITDKELAMARQLIESMSTKWTPDDYHDEFRERLSAIIKARIKSKGATTTLDEAETTPHDATTNVVDFMALLEKSLKDKGKAAPKKTPAKAAKAAKAAKTPAKSAKAASRSRKAS